MTGLPGGGEPDAVGGGAAQRDVAGGGGEGEGLIVVAFEDAQFRGGADAAGFEEFEEATVALVDSADGVSDAGLGVGKEEQSTMTATGGAFHLAHIAVRADAAFAELGEEFGFEVGGDGMFEALGFVVNFPPFHAEEFGEHAFDEVMAKGELAGDLASGGGEAEVAVGLNADEGIFFQAAHGHGDGGCRDFEPVGEAGGDDGFAFALGLEDGFEIVFLGDGDHFSDYTMGLSVVNEKDKTLNTGGTEEHKVQTQVRSQSVEVRIQLAVVYSAF